MEGWIGGAVAAAVRRSEGVVTVPQIDQGLCRVELSGEGGGLCVDGTPYLTPTFPSDKKGVNPRQTGW